MYKIKCDIEAEGNKQTIYRLKEELLRFMSQYSCQCRFDLTDDVGFQEMISSSFRPVIEVDPNDIVDLTMSGDEIFELLEYKKEEEK